MEHIPNVIGVDEVGRGCLAGPVVTAAVILPKDFDYSEINDSKTLKPEKREQLSELIKKYALWEIALKDNHYIDEVNILNATHQAMAEAVNKLSRPKCSVLIDGNSIPHEIKSTYTVKCIIKGDQKITCVAAASIIAKTYRDQLMKDIGLKYPQYGFEKHVGYGTKQHITALQQYGPSPIHRLSFEPIKTMMKQKCITSGA